MKRTRDQILSDVTGLLQTLALDWDLEIPIGAQTRLLGDLNFESLDLVVLGAAVQEHFGQQFPFTELFAEVGQREVRDLTVGEWVDFLYRHLDDSRSPARAAVPPEEQRA